MTDKVKTPVVVASFFNPDVTSGLTIRNEDLTAIAVAKYEEALLSEQKVAAKSLSDANTLTHKLEGELVKTKEAVAKEAMTPLLTKYLKYISDLGLASGGKMSPDFLTREDYDQEQDKNVFKVGVNHPDLPGSRTAWEVIEKPQSVTDFEKSISDSQQNAAAITQRLYEIKKALGRMDLVERQAKATMATHILRQTDKGTELVDSILATISGGNITRLLT